MTMKSTRSGCQHEISVSTEDKETGGGSNSNTSSSSNGKERMTTAARNIRLINILSSDIWLLILHYLSSRELLRCAITCTTWCELLLQ
ncbi:hypothetical protein BDB00DRAFT_835281 [Zychaea mexicana]|uniref:uncharacterized protein n=1 Tax=Zychaea mexicana TaxID=64656 RepID=UPI0022FE0784|nr:uncharacterized protein BDB00DRAFT_835281 [Zychaea mexicana]KAI9490957.1 hypothetical protein BDB00DRAFT_835281 [Zychaea mexicana]